FVAGTYASQAFALELQYARKLEGAAMAERSLSEMRRAAGFDETQAGRWQDGLLRALPDVLPHDRLIGLHLADGTTRFIHNGRPTHTMADREFGRLFFGIWLADTTSEPRLREQLIRPPP
ncbi:MAG TPA: hypothetical protein VHQ87_08050, partial [Rhizobacter sp.]|nr:hypothetical protein [Rhizobacter sp.]